MNKPQFQDIISSTKTFTEEAETLVKEAIQEQLERLVLRERVGSFMIDRLEKPVEDADE
ncbi:hypothetical protein Syun_014502 [Stephania yunnanensis]|uniref:Uncharacterized protein n=1 Tax=Stephania yunnanensis TaxID=152371 RepID=A0AAP0P8U4_9MAGN